MLNKTSINLPTVKLYPAVKNVSKSLPDPSNQFSKQHNLFPNTVHCLIKIKLHV